MASSLCVLALAAFLLWLKLWSPLPIPKVVDSLPITKDALPKANASPMLVTDGTRLYFQEGSLDDTEQNTALMQVSNQGGETIRIPVSLHSPIAYHFSPVHSALLLGGGEFDSTGHLQPLWVLPLPAGPPHRLGDIVAHDACWAPDGRHLAFTTVRDVYVPWGLSTGYLSQ